MPQEKTWGGVLLTQIHEIDYFLDLFGKYKIKILSSKLKKKSNLILMLRILSMVNF